METEYSAHRSIGMAHWQQKHNHSTGPKLGVKETPASPPLTTLSTQANTVRALLIDREASPGSPHTRTPQAALAPSAVTARQRDIRHSSCGTEVWTKGRLRCGRGQVSLQCQEVRRLSHVKTEGNRGLEPSYAQASRSQTVCTRHRRGRGRLLRAALTMAPPSASSS